jgi:hypothetical protein
LHTPGDPDGPHEPLLVLDGDGGRHDVVTQIDAVPDLGEGRACERVADLGSPGGGVQRAEAPRPLRIRDQNPPVVYRDDPSTHLRGRLHDDLFETCGVGDVLHADLCGDPLRLDQRLRLQLGRRTPLKVDGQRDAQRDDQDDEDVREREDEPRSDLRGRLLGLGIRSEPEAHPADRRDVRRMRRIVLDLLAEPGDVHVERLGRAEPMGIPDLVHDPFPAQDLPGVRHQEVQQVELASRELDRFVRPW